MQHQDVIHKSAIVAKDEEWRRLKLRLHVLNDEKSGLHEQLAHKDSRIRALSEQCDKLRAELAGSQQDGRSQRRTQEREVGNLKV